MSDAEPLDVVDADQRVRSDTRLHSEVATDLETTTENAIVVAKDSDGNLAMTGSDRSLGRSIAVLTGKLMLVLPLGLHGILAVTSAATRIAAAQRTRPEAPGVNASDLASDTEQIPPGGAAVIVAIPHSALHKTEKRAKTLGASSGWHTTADAVLAALEQAPGVGTGDQPGPR